MTWAWLTNDRTLVDSSGNVILCNNCPCDVVSVCDQSDIPRHLCLTRGAVKVPLTFNEETEQWETEYFSVCGDNLSRFVLHYLQPVAFFYPFAITVASGYSCARLILRCDGYIWEIRTPILLPFSGGPNTVDFYVQWVGTQDISPTMDIAPTGNPFAYGFLNEFGIVGTSTSIDFGDPRGPLVINADRTGSYVGPVSPTMSITPVEEGTPCTYAPAFGPWNERPNRFDVLWGDYNFQIGTENDTPGPWWLSYNGSFVYRGSDNWTSAGSSFLGNNPPASFVAGGVCDLCDVQTLSYTGSSFLLVITVTSFYGTFTLVFESREIPGEACEPLRLYFVETYVENPPIPLASELTWWFLSNLLSNSGKTGKLTTDSYIELSPICGTSPCVMPQTLTVVVESSCPLLDGLEFVITDKGSYYSGIVGIVPTSDPQYGSGYKYLFQVHMRGSYESGFLFDAMLNCTVGLAGCLGGCDGTLGSYSQGNVYANGAYSSQFSSTAVSCNPLVVASDEVEFSLICGGNIGGADPYFCFGRCLEYRDNCDGAYIILHVLEE